MLRTHGYPTQLISRDLPFCQSRRCILTVTPPPLFRNLVRGWNPQKAVSALRNAQCVFLDVDSTLSNQEGLDELARYLGKDKAICQLTEQAMSGEMTVEDAFAERIRLLSPTRQEIASFLQSHTPQINPGVASFLSLLRKRGTAFYLVSGGFLEVEPLCRVLQIPLDHVVCNRFLFATDGSCLGYDTSRWTCRSHGKSLAIKAILESHGWVHSVMIGDGVTDLETRDVVDAFIGYAGVKDREAVQNAADLSMTSFETLLPFLS